MSKVYGFLGILMIIFSQVLIIFRVQPFILFYFPIVWWGYILLVDSLVYVTRKNSLLMNRRKQFLIYAALSLILWGVFDLANIPLHAWTYVNFPSSLWYKIVHSILSFSTVVPAFMENVELIQGIPLFHKMISKIKFKKYKIHRIEKGWLYIFIITGVGCAAYPLLFPILKNYGAPAFLNLLGWYAFFFLLDPINYLHNKPSIIGFLIKGEIDLPLALLLSIAICGFLWEFWNYWAQIKWVYNAPFLGDIKLFEMPILGYIFYLPFAFELFAMYHFVTGTLKEKIKSLLK